MLHTDRRSLQNAVRNILDGELLNKYLYLSTMERSELAKKIGTTQDIVSTWTEERIQWSQSSYSNVLCPPFITRSWTTFWRSTEWQLISESRIPTSRPLNAVLYRLEKMFCYRHFCENLFCFSYLLDKKEQPCFLRIFCIKNKTSVKVIYTILLCLCCQWLKTGMPLKKKR